MSHLRHIRVVFLQFHADPVISCCSGVLQRVLKIRSVCLASHQIREGYVVAFVLFMRCQYRRIDKCHVLLLLLSQASACVVFRFPDNVCSPRCLPLQPPHGTIIRCQLLLQCHHNGRDQLFLSGNYTRKLYASFIFLAFFHMEGLADHSLCTVAFAQKKRRFCQNIG